MNLQEFTTNSLGLQKVIKNTQRNSSEKQLCSDLDETYAKSTIRLDFHIYPGDQTILMCVEVFYLIASCLILMV